jgi:hypothetical protein
MGVAWAVLPLRYGFTHNYFHFPELMPNYASDFMTIRSESSVRTLGSSFGAVEVPSRHTFHTQQSFAKFMRFAALACRRQINLFHARAWIAFCLPAAHPGEGWRLLTACCALVVFPAQAPPSPLVICDIERRPRNIMT